MQSPIVLILITPVEDVTAHTDDVDVAYVTARLEETVAPALNAGASKSLPEMDGNVIVWLIFPATIVCVTHDAAL